MPKFLVKILLFINIFKTTKIQASTSYFKLTENIKKKFRR